MKKYGSNILVASLFLGTALGIFPLAGNAGTEIKNSPHYENQKRVWMEQYGNNLEREIVFEKEGQTLAIERHFLKGGKDPLSYFTLTREKYFGIFKGNEVVFLGPYTQGVDYTTRPSPPDSTFFEELTKYLEAAKTNGYNAFLRIDLNKKSISPRQIPMPELIKTINSIR